MHLIVAPVPSGITWSRGTPARRARPRQRSSEYGAPCVGERQLDLASRDSKSVLAFNLSYLFDRVDVLELAMADLIGWLEAGDIQPPGVTLFPLAEAAEAHRAIESGQTTGKLILVP